ncbi:hypothetical protein GGF43_002784, partial [Coemansia sp. RSA 2618]
MYFSPPSSGSTSTQTLLASSRPLRLVLKTTPATRQPAARAATPQTVYAKSGQLVRSCLKGNTRSAVPRFVHFGAELEHVRRFYKAEPSMNAASNPKPSASAQTECNAPPTAVMTPIRKPAPMFPLFEPSPVVLETVEYDHESLRGTIKVHNLAFEKHIFVRITKDEWKTIEDVPAVFQRSISGVDGCRPGLDRFSFAIPAAAAQSTVCVSMCVCYRVDGQEFWDSNQGANYLFKISPAAATAAPSASTSAMPSNDTLDCDAVKTCSKSSDFSYGFASPTAQTAQDPSPAIPPVSNADARRYMQYSEAKFASVAAPNHTAYSSCVSKLQTELASMYEGFPLF